MYNILKYKSDNYYDIIVYIISYSLYISLFIITLIFLLHLAFYYII